MLPTVLYGFLACAGFFVGVLVGSVTRPPRQLVAAIMAFGGGVLVSALTFDLIEEANAEGSTTYVIVGFLAGAFIYVLADLALEGMARASPKREGRDRGEIKVGAGRIAESPGQAVIGDTAFLIGAVLDGIPRRTRGSASAWTARGPAWASCCWRRSSSAMCRRASAARSGCGRRAALPLT